MKKFDLTYRSIDNDELEQLSGKIGKEIKAGNGSGDLSLDQIERILHKVSNFHNISKPKQMELISHLSDYSFTEGQEMNAAQQIQLLVAAEHNCKEISQARNQIINSIPSEDSKPVESANHREASTKKMMAAVIAVFSGITTYMACSNFLGGLLQKSDFQPEDSLILRLTLSGTAAVFSSLIIFAAKNRVNTFIESGHRVLTALRKAYLEKPHQTNIALIILVLSIISNAVGGAMILGEKPEYHNQLNQAIAVADATKAKVIGSIDLIEHTLSDDKINRLKNEILDAELKGKSTSQAEGKRYYWHAKDYFLNHTSSSLAYVDSNQYVLSESHLNKVEALRTLLRKLAAQPQNTDDFSKTVSTLRDEYIGVIKSRLSLVDEKLAMLAEGKLSRERANIMLANLEKEFVTLTVGSASFDKSLAHLKTEIKAYTDYCTDAIGEINALANNTGVTIFESLTPTLPTIVVPKMRVEEIRYKEPIEVARYFIESKGVFGAVTVTLMVILCLLLDILDMFKLKGLRNRVFRDKEVIFSRRKKYYDPVFEAIVDVIFQRLHQSAAFKNLRSGIIQRVIIWRQLRKTLDSLVPETAIEDEAGMLEWWWFGVKKTWRSWTRLNTAPAEAYNIECECLEQFRKDAGYLVEIYRQLFKQSVIDGILVHPTNNKRKLNDQHLDLLLLESQTAIKKEIANIRKSRDQSTPAEVTYYKARITRLENLLKYRAGIEFEQPPETVNTSTLQLNFVLSQVKDAKITEFTAVVNGQSERVSLEDQDEAFSYDIQLTDRQNDIEITVIDQYDRRAHESFTVQCITDAVIKEEVARATGELAQIIEVSVSEMTEHFLKTLLEFRYKNDMVRENATLDKALTTLKRGRSSLSSLTDHMEGRFQHIIQCLYDIVHNRYVPEAEQETLRRSFQITYRYLKDILFKQLLYAQETFEHYEAQTKQYKDRPFPLIEDCFNSLCLQDPGNTEFIDQLVKGMYETVIKPISEKFDIPIASYRFPGENFIHDLNILQKPDAEAIGTVDTAEYIIKDLFFISRVEIEITSMEDDKIFQRLHGDADTPRAVTTSIEIDPLKEYHQYVLGSTSLFHGENTLTVTYFNAWNQRIENETHNIIRLSKEYMSIEADKKREREKIEAQKRRDAEARKKEDLLREQQLERDLIEEVTQWLVARVINPYEEVVDHFNSIIAMVVLHKISHEAPIQKGLITFDYSNSCQDIEPADVPGYDALDPLLTELVDTTISELAGFVKSISERNACTVVAGEIVDAFVSHEDEDPQTIIDDLSKETRPEIIDKLAAYSYDKQVFTNEYLLPDGSETNRETLPSLNMDLYAGPKTQEANEEFDLDKLTNLMDAFRVIILCDIEALDLAEVTELTEKVHNMLMQLNQLIGDARVNHQDNPSYLNFYNTLHTKLSPIQGTLNTILSEENKNPVWWRWFQNRKVGLITLGLTFLGYLEAVYGEETKQRFKQENELTPEQLVKRDSIFKTTGALDN
ncbi:MAG: hypothetical protein QNK37_00110 [Acidobacteriota bacterium]|nr:hypothetical protein [Acidobacteriota bacterium]